jgi:hypothetical protein
MAWFDVPDFEQLDPLHFDRALLHVTQSWVRGRRRLRSGAEFDVAPFDLAPWVASRTAFDAVSALPAQDPLREPLLRWVFRLLEERVNWTARIEWERTRREAAYGVDSGEGRIALTLAAMVRRLLNDPGRETHWIRTMVAHAGEAGGRRTLLWQRRAEVARRLKLDPVDPFGMAHGAEMAARDWLRRTDELFDELGVGGPSDWLSFATARAAADGWPARITPATLQGLLGERGLCARVEIDPGPLPAALAPASFVRSFARIGAALRDARAPKDQPFCIAHDASGFTRLCFGALFAHVPLLVSFQQRKLDVPRTALRDRFRNLGGMVLIASRKLAHDVLLRHAEIDGGEAPADLLGQIDERELKAGGLAKTRGALFLPRSDAAERLLAWLAASTMAEQLKDDHDEDWYRNPRAVDEVHERAALPAQASGVEADAEHGADAAERYVRAFFA